MIHQDATSNVFQMICSLRRLPFLISVGLFWMSGVMAFSVTPTGGWQELDDGSNQLTTAEDGSVSLPSLVIKGEIKPNSYYRPSWRAKSESASSSLGRL